MKIETGIDIIDIKRIKEKFENNCRFLSLIFTENEMLSINKIENPYQILAGRWASKEAFSKALGTGIGEDLDWKDIEISNDISGKPEIKVKDDIIKKFNVKSISLSISHVSEYAVASVVLIIDNF